MARLKNYSYAALTFGLALAIGLIAWQGLDAIAGVLAEGGWSLALLGGFFFLILFVAAIAYDRSRNKER